MLDNKLSRSGGNLYVNTKCKGAAVSIQMKHLKQMGSISTDNY